MHGHLFPARFSTWALLAQGVAKSLRLPFVNLFELTLVLPFNFLKKLPAELA